MDGTCSLKIQMRGRPLKQGAHSSGTATSIDLIRLQLPRQPTKRFPCGPFLSPLRFEAEASNSSPRSVHKMENSASRRNTSKWLR